MEIKEYHSPKAEEMHARVQAFLDGGVRRSIYAYGPPGTGKSCLASTIASKVGGTCLRIPTEFSATPSVLGVVKLFRPNVLIMDDVGRAQDPSATFLATLEELNSLVDLLIVTSNTVDLAPALLRPGRFDEIIEITTLGPEVVKLIIGNILDEIKPPKEVVDAIYSWPSAFIKELADRVEILGTISFMREFKLLEERVAKNIEEKESTKKGKGKIG
jgi:SpoVK/Ycf46/Vps4 family AAA+-type ATPase